MRKFYDEIWFHIAGYFVSLKSFARFWWSNPHLFRNELTHNSQFWTAIISYFCRIRHKDFSELSGRIDLKESGVWILRSLHSERRCSRSGCYQMYTEWENGATQCMYHPGKLRSTGHMSCCRGKGFTAPGCKAAFHDGAVFSLIHMRRDPIPRDHHDSESLHLPLISSPKANEAFAAHSRNKTAPSFLPNIK